MASATQANRFSVLGALLAAIVLSWAYVAMMDMPIMPTMAMPMAWSASYAASLFAMWVLMMAAMMLPSAAPTILILDRFRKSTSTTVHFAVGYAVVWIAFSAFATSLQWSLERAALLSGDMAVTSARLAAGIFIAAGAYQFTPVKRACIDACRSPMQFLSTHWREGSAGALRMGIVHGVHCLGCCWLLMGLLFVGGVMNLMWIAPIAAFVFVEKLVPGGDRLGRWSGLLFIGWGVFALYFT